MKKYSNFIAEIRFLRKNVNWYDFFALQNVDILVSLLDEYNLARALSIQPDPLNSDIQRKCQYPCTLNPNLITIAWVRNWFQRWLTRPFIGNYHLVMVSSDYAHRFYEDYREHIGFQIQCFQSCPSYSFPQQLIGFDTVNKTSGDDWPWIVRDLDHFQRNISTQVVSNSRPKLTLSIKQRTSSGLRNFNTVIKVLRLATNQHRFTTVGSRNLNITADYGFTGNFHGSHRRIAQFDPETLPELKGVVIGAGWNNPNSPGTSKWRKLSVGYVPYEQMPAVRFCLFTVISNLVILCRSTAHSKLLLTTPIM